MKPATTQLFHGFIPPLSADGSAAPCPLQYFRYILHSTLSEKHPLKHPMLQGAVYSLISSVKSETDRNGAVYHGHLGFVQMSHMLPQTAFVDGPDLFQENNGIFA